ncbi:MAG: response regulator transcription factor [Clostridia bacterium]|nr:response regulator transcription factor [Clostridia bacterium]
MRLLLVEDEADLANAIRRRLREAGYSVDSLADGEEALAATATVDYDAIILDLRLPGLSGLEVLRTLRRQGRETPVLILTALGALEDRVEGLDAGADDYLVKPFAFEELLARIRALLRRQGAGPRSLVLKAGPIRLDTVRRDVTVHGQPLYLTAKEFALLHYFLRNPDRVLTRSQIAEHVWDYDYTGMSNVVDVYVGYLRKKLGEHGEQGRIETIRGVGYRLRSQPDGR